MKRDIVYSKKFLAHDLLQEFDNKLWWAVWDDMDDEDNDVNDGLEYRYFEILLHFDTNDCRLKDHPELEVYELVVYDEQAFEKYKSVKKIKEFLENA